MNVIIAGAGEVGGHAAEVLSSIGHSVSVIDLDESRLEQLDESLDVRTLRGHCAHLNVLEEAGIERCELFVAATQIDEINMLAAGLAKSAGAKRTFVRVHHTANFSLRNTDHARNMGIDEMICPEHLTALALARTLRNPGLIALEEFGRGQLIMQTLTVEKGAPAAGQCLADVKLPPSARLATVESETGAHIARASTRIAEGDQVTLIGQAQTFDQARRLFHKGRERHLGVSIMGETATAVWLCRALRGRSFSVRLFVEEHARAEELAEKLDHVTVLEADPTDAMVFAEEHLENVDAFVAVTDDDERNILACAQAKALGVPKAVAVVQRTKYMHLFSHVGIDHAFSPRSVAVNTLRAMIDVTQVRKLATFAEGVAAVYEVHPSRRGRVLGHELRNVELPPQTMIAAVQRGEAVVVPGAEDQILADDVVLVIGPVGLEKELSRSFLD